MRAIMHTFTYQSKTAQNWQTVDQFEYQVEQTGWHDDQIENVPPAVKKVLAKSHYFQTTLERKNGSKNLES